MDPAAALDFDFRFVPPAARDTLDDWAQRGGLVLDLVRRGVDHGALVVGDLPPAATADPEAAWHAARPVFLPDLLTRRAADRAAEIEATLEMFERLRSGARFLDEVDARLADHELFRYASSSVDQLDQREIEKLFVDVQSAPGAPRLARDLSAKLAWVADDERDLSLRIRFSFGHEATRDWLDPEDHRALWSDRFADALFPECDVITGSAGLADLLGTLLPAPFRLSERIIYNNVPGGGAAFHHDADPGQRGVVFAQLAGVTVWLALPLTELAAEVAAAGGARDVATAREALQHGPDQALWTLLNIAPEFTARLHEAGHLYALGPGDALLLPSHDPARCCWHAVFGTGPEPSLGHSDGLFDAPPEAAGVD